MEPHDLFTDQMERRTRELRFSDFSATEVMRTAHRIRRRRIAGAMVATAAAVVAVAVPVGMVVSNNSGQAVGPAAPTSRTTDNQTPDATPVQVPNDPTPHLRACTASDQLRLHPAGVSEAGGDIYLGYQITSSAPCTVQGFPRVQMWTDDGRQIVTSRDGGQFTPVAVGPELGSAAVVLRSPSCSSPDAQSLATVDLSLKGLGENTRFIDQAPYCAGADPVGPDIVALTAWEGDFTVLPSTAVIDTGGLGEIRYDAWDPSMPVHQAVSNCGDAPLPVTLKAVFTLRGATGGVWFSQPDAPGSIYLTLYANGSPRTAEGIGYGSTMADLKAAYPDHTWTSSYDGPDNYVVDIDGVPLAFNGPDLDADGAFDFVDTVLINSTYLAPC